MNVNKLAILAWFVSGAWFTAALLLFSFTDKSFEPVLYLVLFLVNFWQGMSIQKTHEHIQKSLNK